MFAKGESEETERVSTWGLTKADSPGVPCHRSVEKLMSWSSIVRYRSAEFMGGGREEMEIKWVTKH
jgi:hypothetical protein